jgi:fatty acid CoA ligase FadD9
VTVGAQAVAGFQTFDVTNPHDDGISLDEFVDWLIEAGHPIQRIDDYGGWFTRFDTAIRALPEQQRQVSLLPLLHAYRRPAPPLRGSAIPAKEFTAAVQAARRARRSRSPAPLRRGRGAATRGADGGET